MSEFVWFEDLSESRQENSSDGDKLKMDEIQQFPFIYNYDDLVWFENTKIEMKQSSMERNVMIKHDLKNQTIKMGNLTNETLEALKMFDLSGYLHFVGFDSINNNEDEFDSKEQNNNIMEGKGILGHIEEDEDATHKMAPRVLDVGENVILRR